MEIEKEKIDVGHSVRVDSLDLKNLFNLTGQLLILKNIMIESPEISNIKEPKLRQGLAELDRLTKKIEESALSLKLTPIKGLILKIHRMVFEISKKANKSVELQYEGEDTRVDREIIDYLSDIFTHLVRNSIDHGVENVQERMEIGKKETSVIFLKFSSKGREIKIEFSDDGRGIDKKKVLQKAIDKKIIESDTDINSISEESIFSLLFHGGLSTAKSITDISGRGVGLGFVKSTVDKLRGKIQTKSTFGKGTTFIITLPIDTSIMDVLVAEINGIKYLISLGDIDRVYLVNEIKIHHIPKSKGFIIENGRPIPLIEPSGYFPGTSAKITGKEAILVFSLQNSTFGLFVNDLLHQTQIVFNPLPQSLIGRLNFISGSASMPSGEVSHLIDLGSLVDFHLEMK